MNKNLAAAEDKKNRDKETNAETAWVRTTLSLVISCNILHARYIVVRSHVYIYKERASSERYNLLSLLTLMLSI